MSAEAGLKPARRVLVQPVEDGLTLLNLETGQYYQLEGAGAVIWELLRDTGSPDIAATSLTGRYGIDLDTATRDVAGLAASLEAAGLMVRDNLPHDPHSDLREN